MVVNCCIETKSTKSCCIETKRPKLSPAAGDLFDGLQSNLIDHMVSGEPKKFPWSMETISMVSKMQKSAHGLKCTKTMVSPGFIRIPVGNKSTSILFIPRTTTESFLTWDFNDPRFRQWQLDGPDPLERLRQSKRGEDLGPREKNKASGRTRERDDEDGTLAQGTRSKGQQQAGAHQLPGNDAASGGGSTSEGMHE